MCNTTSKNLWARVAINQDNQYLVLEIIDFDPEDMYHKALRWAKVPSRLEPVIRHGFLYDPDKMDFYLPSKDFLFRHGSGDIFRWEQQKIRRGVSVDSSIYVAASDANILMLQNFLKESMSALYTPSVVLEAHELPVVIKGVEKARQVLRDIRRFRLQLADQRYTYTQKLLEVTKKGSKWVSDEELELLAEIKQKLNNSTQELESQNNFPLF